MLRLGYIEEHKDEIVDPMAKTREYKLERTALAEEYEILYGRKPHSLTSIGTLKKKIASKG